MVFVLFVIARMIFGILTFCISRALLRLLIILDCKSKRVCVTLGGVVVFYIGDSSFE